MCVPFFAVTTMSKTRSRRKLRRKVEHISGIASGGLRFGQSAEVAEYVNIL
jgi:hypothetical protein